MRILIALALTLMWDVQAQEPVQQQEPKTDKPIFDVLTHPSSVQGVLEFPFYSFYLGAPSVDGVAYLPNFSPRLGPRILWNDIGTTVTFALPIPKNEMKRRGDSKQTGIIINNYWRDDALDIYYQYFAGFYASSPFTELSAHRPEIYPQLPDARATNYGINWYHVVNKGNYSLKAAFSQSEFQRQSGGAWLINPFYNHLELALGAAFVPGSDPNALKVEPNLAAGKFDTMGVAGGYGYTYIHNSFFANIQATAGPGAQYQRFQRVDRNDSNVVSLALKLNGNAAIGWNDNDYVGGFKVLVDSLASKIVDTRIASSMISAQFFFGQRF